MIPEMLELLNTKSSEEMDSLIDGMREELEESMEETRMFIADGKLDQSRRKRAIGISRHMVEVLKLTIIVDTNNPSDKQKEFCDYLDNCMVELEKMLA